MLYLAIHSDEFYILSSYLNQLDGFFKGDELRDATKK